jgi:hypothetical protein
LQHKETIYLLYNIPTTKQHILYKTTWFIN